MNRLRIGLAALVVLLSGCGIDGDPLTPPVKSSSSPIIAHY